jgi:hypothetical protein
VTDAPFEGQPLDEIKAQIQLISDALDQVSGRDVELEARRDELRLELVRRLRRRHERGGRHR